MVPLVKNRIPFKRCWHDLTVQAQIKDSNINSTVQYILQFSVQYIKFAQGVSVNRVNILQCNLGNMGTKGTEKLYCIWRWSYFSGSFFS